MMADMTEPDLQPASTSSTDHEVTAMNWGELHVEQLISDRLMRGYTLLAGACPVCSTPLIKNELEKHVGSNDCSILNGPNNKFPIIVSSESFEQPFMPVIGVPFCVTCHSHVVTSEEDVDLLETSESFKEKGSILVAMQEHDDDDDDDNDERRQEMEEHNPADEDTPTQHAVHEPANDDDSQVDASSFNKSIGSIMKESETILGRNPIVDPNRFSTALFCGTTASRQLVSTSPVNGEETEEEQQLQQVVLDPYNENLRSSFGFEGVEQELERNAFADALEEEEEEEEQEVIAHTKGEGHQTLNILSMDTTTTTQILIEERKEDEVYNEDVCEDLYEEEACEEDDDEENTEVMMVEYSVRRQIATKLMGAKLLEGYTLRDAQCDKCGMPVMEYGGDLACVVCPVLLQHGKSAPLMLSPDARKAQAFEQRWVEEATNAAEEQAIRKEEVRRNALVRETEERMVEEARTAAIEDHHQEVLRELEVSSALTAIEQHRADVQRKAKEIADVENRQATMQLEMELAELKAFHQAEIEHEVELEVRRQAHHEQELELEAQCQEEIEQELLVAEKARQAELKRELQECIRKAERQAEIQQEIEIGELHHRRQAEIQREAEIAEMEDRHREKIKQIQLDESARHREIRGEIELEMKIASRMSKSNSTSPVVFIPHLFVDSNPRMLMSSGTRTASPGGSTPVEAALSADSALLTARMYADATLMAEVEAKDEGRVEETVEAEKVRLLQDEAMSPQDALAMDQRRKNDELRISQDTRKLELMEEQRLFQEALINENNFREGQGLLEHSAIEAERQRYIEVTLQEAQRLTEVETARKARVVKEQETRNAMAQKKTEKEEMELATIEREVEQKQTDADIAIAKAQIALEQVETTKRGIFAQAIAQAEAEAIAEAEETALTVEEEAEALRQSMVLSRSVKDLEKERWDTLRAEGRSTLTRRMMQGWKLNDDLCRGEHCRHSPIVAKDRIVECVVCGGSGAGNDGVYSAGKAAAATPEDDTANEVVAVPSLSVLRVKQEPMEETLDIALMSVRHVGQDSAKEALDPAPLSIRHTDQEDLDAVSVSERHVDQDPVKDSMHAAPVPGCYFNQVQREEVMNGRVPLSPPGELTNDFEDENDDFENKRERVSKEIASKMIDGWILIDLSCPHCVMPLMVDGLGGPETCVICGPVELEEETEKDEPMTLEEKVAIEQAMKATLDSPRIDSPASVTASTIAKNKNDPPATFLREDYDASSPRVASPQVVSPRLSESDVCSPRSSNPRIFESPAETVIDPVLEATPLFFDTDRAFNLPAGIDMDDDLMSIAQSMARSAQGGEIEGERAISASANHVVTKTDVPLDVSTLEFASDHSVDNVSHMSGLTRNTSSRMTLKTDFEEDRGETDTRTLTTSSRGPPQKPMDTIGSQSPQANRRLPPRPGSNERRPPMAPGGTLSSPKKYSKKRSTLRRGPPRPEERSSGGSRRNKDDTRSVSPRNHPGEHSSDRDLSVSLDHVRDRDDVSIISEGGYSKSETVASEVLDTILTRIEECKSVLASTPRTQEEFTKQLEMAGMIEKLASAAVAVRKLEEVGGSNY